MARNLQTDRSISAASRSVRQAAKSAQPAHKPRRSYRRRRLVAVLAALAALVGLVIANPASYDSVPSSDAGSSSGVSSGSSQTATPGSPSDATSSGTTSSDASPSGGTSSDTTSSDTASQPSSSVPSATAVLAELAIKGRAPKTGYARDEFYSSWPTVDGCNLRQRILRRELGSSATLAADGCTVISGEFDEPYTGKHLVFSQKSDLSTGLQIDHVVALSDAWQKGAQYQTKDERYQLATDPLNLIAVDSSANQTKSDGDAATWLPANKSFRCQYVARQVSVKYKYHLWVTQAEHDAIAGILATCPNEPSVGIDAIE